MRHTINIYQHPSSENPADQMTKSAMKQAAVTSLPCQQMESIVKLSLTLSLMGIETYDHKLKCPISKGAFNIWEHLSWNFTWTLTHIHGNFIVRQVWTYITKSYHQAHAIRTPLKLIIFIHFKSGEERCKTSPERQWTIKENLVICLQKWLNE